VGKQDAGHVELFVVEEHQTIVKVCQNGGVNIDPVDVTSSGMFHLKMSDGRVSFCGGMLNSRGHGIDNRSPVISSSSSTPIGVSGMWVSTPTTGFEHSDVEEDKRLRTHK
jgi:hypothetical protein